MQKEIRIMTYNVHSCFGRDRKPDPARIAEVISQCKPDIIALQEVDVARARSGGIDQAAMIAHHLQMTSHFYPALNFEEERYGDALLTAFPTQLRKAGPLPSIGEQRGALWVEVDCDGVALQFFVTHLGLRATDRQKQITSLLGPEWMGPCLERGDHIVLAGDLNAFGRSAAIRRISEHLRDVAAHARQQPTFPSRLPVLRLDYIFTSIGTGCGEVFVHNSALSRVASDHLPVVADVILPVPDEARPEPAGKTEGQRRFFQEHPPECLVRSAGPGQSEGGNTHG